MAGRWPTVERLADVRHVDRLVGAEEWAELIGRIRAQAAPVVRVSPAQLKALYAPAPEEVDSWPVLPEGGVVAELRSGR